MCRADNLNTFMCWLSWNLGAPSSWNPQACTEIAVPVSLQVHLCCIAIELGNTLWLPWLPVHIAVFSVSHMLRQKKQSSIKRLVQQCRTRWQHSDRYQHLVYSENKAAERCCIVACGYYGSPSYKGLMGVWEKTMHNLEDNENKGNGALGGIISQKIKLLIKRVME